MQTARAVANFHELAVLADGVVLARGCLGTHVAAEKIAVLQKRLITAANQRGKLVLVTRIVDSMSEVPRPTRAEATDIANSVLDGAGAHSAVVFASRESDDAICCNRSL